MYKLPTFQKTSLKGEDAVEGETLEVQIEKLMENNEPLEGEAPLIYQERSEGINAAYDIRTDRFEIAIEACDKITKSYSARREERQELNKKDGKPESTHGKETTPETSK